MHDFQEVLVIVIAAMLSDCDTIEDIARWGREREDWLRQFLVLRNGVASEETFLRIFRALDPKQFEAAFRRWVAGVVGTLKGGLEVDGKTAGGSGSGGDSLPKVGDHESKLERRYYISSREPTAEQLAAARRAHWGIESRLHWFLRVGFGKDASAVRKDNAPQNLSLLKKIVLNLIRLDTADKTKTSLRLKRKCAAWTDDVRVKILGATSLGFTSR